MTLRFRVLPLWPALGLLFSLACGDAAEPSDVELEGATSALSQGPQYERFAAFDASGQNAYGIEGILPPNEELAYQYTGMGEQERSGLAAWHLFGAYRGKFFRRLQLETNNASNMLRVLDSRKRNQRFENTGLLNDPDCRQRTTPDQFGLYVDDCGRDPYSTGAVGLRLRPNPDFDMEKWKALGNGDVRKAAEKWIEAPKNRFEWKSEERTKTTSVEPPYEVVMTCTVCHAAPNPLAPPQNPNEASWKEIVFAIGNQFFKESKVFVDAMPPDDFLSQALNAQHPGTSDTSRMANDHLFNPNTINAIFNLSHRPLHKERVSQFDEQGDEVWNGDIKPETCDGETCEVDTFRVLKDGGDSSGPSGAALRVYINIGACYDEFQSDMDPVWGMQHPTVPGRLQTPVSRRRLEQTCPDYQRLLPYTGDIISYLKFVKPYRLKYAPGGAAKVKAWNDPVMQLGRKVYAEECATCHSSMQPEYPTAEPTVADTEFERQFATWTKGAQDAWLHDPARVAWFKERVDDPAFFENNFLSDDRRYPLSLIGTNSARALGTNAARGNVWDQYASLTVQTMPPVEIPVLKNPGTLFEYTTSVKGPVGRGYYRTPSLWGVWATAPFLNNNALGAQAQGVSVEARLQAYDDAAQRLLGLLPRQRKIAKTNRFTALTNIPITFPIPSWLPIDKSLLQLGLPVPPGVPVAVVANLENTIIQNKNLQLSDLLSLLADPVGFYEGLAEDFIPVLDSVEDKGHTFGQNRSVEERLALIEFMKSL